MHLTPEDDALLQELLDGTLEPAEREAAERLVQTNGDARRRRPSSRSSRGCSTGSAAPSRRWISRRR